MIDGNCFPHLVVSPVLIKFSRFLYYIQDIYLSRFMGMIHGYVNHNQMNNIEKEFINAELIEQVKSHVQLK